MWLMLQSSSPEDFVIATGDCNSLQEFVSTVFRTLNLDWIDHLESDPYLFRPSDIRISYGDPSKAKQKLGWSANLKMEQIIQHMIHSELASTPFNDNV